MCLFSSSFEVAANKLVTTDEHTSFNQLSMNRVTTGLLSKCLVLWFNSNGGLWSFEGHSLFAPAVRTASLPRRHDSMFDFTEVTSCSKTLAFQNRLITLVHVWHDGNPNLASKFHPVIIRYHSILNTNKSSESAQAWHEGSIVISRINSSGWKWKLLTLSNHQNKATMTHFVVESGLSKLKNPYRNPGVLGFEEHRFVAPKKTSERPWRGRHYATLGSLDTPSRNWTEPHQKNRPYFSLYWLFNREPWEWFIIIPI